MFDQRQIAAARFCFANRERSAALQNSNGFVAAYVRKLNPSLSVLCTAKELGLTNTAALYRFFRGEFQWLGVAKQERLAKLLSSKRRSVSVRMIKRDIERRKGASVEKGSP